MAISDVLHDAAAEIDEYLADHPEMYADLSADLRELVSRMRALQTRLDKPPGVAEH